MNESKCAQTSQRGINMFTFFDYDDMENGDKGLCRMRGRRGNINPLFFKRKKKKKKKNLKFKFFFLCLFSFPFLFLFPFC